MAINYVRFQRGTREAYSALKQAGKIDNNTLYFIYPETDNSIGELYLGNRIISGGDVTIASASLNDLSDVIITETGEHSFLVREGDNWVSKSLEDIIALIGAGSSGGEVVAPAQVIQVDTLENEDPYDALSRITADKNFVAGDIVIVKDIFVTTKAQYTAFVFDGDMWAPMDGNYNASTVYFDKDFVFTEKIGTVDIPTSGSTTVSAAGKNVQDFFAGLFAKEKQPSKVDPSVTIQLAGAGSVEVGKKVTPNFTATFNSGSYTYGPTPTGVAVTSWEITSTAGESFTTPTGTLKEITVGDDTNFTVTAKANYSEGLPAKTNIGNDSNVKIEAGAKSKISSAITGYRNSFYGSSLVVEDLDSTKIRSLTAVKSSNNSFTVNVAEGAKQVTIALPVGRKLSVVADEAAFGTDIKEKFVLTSVDVEGLNGYTAKEYNVYTYRPSTALGKNTYQVTVING